MRAQEQCCRPRLMVVVVPYLVRAMSACRWCQPHACHSFGTCRCLGNLNLLELTSGCCGNQLTQLHTYSTCGPHASLSLWTVTSHHCTYIYIHRHCLRFAPEAWASIQGQRAFSSAPNRPLSTEMSGDETLHKPRWGGDLRVVLLDPPF